MLEDFITSALIIDDAKDEIEDLMKYLDQRDIWTKHFTPEEIQQRDKPFKNRKIIFLDLYLDDSKKSVENIALIRKYFKSILGQDFGTYGVVLWTKHSNHFDEFCQKIYNEKNPFTKPLFIVALDKTVYKAKGNYEGLLEDLEIRLSKDIAASFFIEWNKAVKSGSDNTITTIYELFTSNEEKQANLEPILHKLACNYTGIPIENTADYDLQKDLVKSLMDPLQFEISKEYQNISDLFINGKDQSLGVDTPRKVEMFSQINSLLLLDSNNLSQLSAIPGNIYEVVLSDSPLYINSFIDKNNKEINIETDDDFKALNKKRICLEVTPPCDFALHKKQLFSRIIGGILLDYDEGLARKKSYFKGENFYNFLHPLKIDGFDKPQMMVFDFYRFQTIKEEQLRNQTNYKIIMKTKDKLFADILQKFSAHTARLGIAILYPNS